MGAAMMATRPDPAGLYHPAMPATWWLRKRSYFLFMLRELSSVFIAGFLVVLLLQIAQIASGEDARAAFSAMLRSPGWILFHGVALAFAVYHSVTWFYTTSIVMPLRVGGRELPRWLFTALNIGAWAGVSLVILILYLALPASA